MAEAATPVTFYRFTEAADTRILEDGDNRITEEG